LKLIATPEGRGFTSVSEDIGEGVGGGEPALLTIEGDGMGVVSVLGGDVLETIGKVLWGEGVTVAREDCLAVSGICCSGHAA